MRSGDLSPGPPAPAEVRDATPAVRVVLREAASASWLAFEVPRQLLIARRLQDVVPVLRAMDDAVERGGCHAAGFVSYEAAPAFDAHLVARSEGDFPYAWFGLFDVPRVLPELPGGRQAGAPDNGWQASVTPEEYRTAFDALREYIRNGDTYQVNLTYRLRARLRDDPWSMFQALAAGGEVPCAAFVDTGEWALCSGSPELFFRLDGEKIESQPMKGTAARGLWPEEDRRRAAALRDSPKERAENVMIVDMVRNDLGRVSRTGTVRVAELCAVRRYPTVWQMTSTVQAQTREPLDRIFAGLFPPASIVGVPKRRAMEIIAELETSPRRLYTGAIGYAAPGRRAQFNVAIRTLVIDRSTGLAEYGIGGGIVWDSQCERELDECRVKARALTARQTSFELVETLRWDPVQGYALLPFHLSRLAQSADYFGFAVDVAEAAVALDCAAAGLSALAYRVRLLLDRRGRVCCEARHLTPAEESFAEVALAAAPVDRDDVFLYHKTTQREQYARALALRPGFADVLLYNEAGEITESTIANVAVDVDGVLCTPPVRCGLLAGTYRAWLMAEGRLRERVLRREDVLSGRPVYLMNAVRGMHRVSIATGSRHGASLDGLEHAR